MEKNKFGTTLTLKFLDIDANQRLLTSNLKFIQATHRRRHHRLTFLNETDYHKQNEWTSSSSEWKSCVAKKPIDNHKLISTLGSTLKKEGKPPPIVRLRRLWDFTTTTTTQKKAHKSDQKALPPKKRRGTFIISLFPWLILGAAIFPPFGSRLFFRCCKIIAKLENGRPKVTFFDEPHNHNRDQSSRLGSLLA